MIIIHKSVKLLECFDSSGRRVVLDGLSFGGLRKYSLGSHKVAQKL